MIARYAGLIAVLGFVVASQTARAEPVLAGGGVPPEGAVVAVGFEGLGFGPSPGEGGPVEVTEWVAWSRVIDPGDEWRERATQFRGVWDPAWRARDRLLRGDTLGAEPLLEELFEIYAGRADPTAAEVAAGLARARLARGARFSALEPWLSWVSAHEAGISSDATRDTLDGEPTVLLAALPPFFGDEEGAARAAERLRVVGWIDPERSRAADSLRRLYVAAMGDEPAPDGLYTSDRGVRFLAQLLDAAYRDDALGGDARAALASRLRRREIPEPWAEAWARVAVGTGMVRSIDVGERLEGVTHLLHLPARLSKAAPSLAPIALRTAASALDELGEKESAATLWAEAERFDTQRRALP
ncbi:MAG: hypothetical protein AAGG07_03690 [Planctomycetota bacterium]